jgi:hypothetical protein
MYIVFSEWFYLIGNHPVANCIPMLFQVPYWRYARCWWHLMLHIINVEKNVSRLLFHFFQQLRKSEAKNKQTISKLKKQKTKKRKQNTKIYQTWKNNYVFPLTQATLITKEFMTLICVCVIFEQALQKRMCALHCRNYNYIIVINYFKILKWGNKNF